MRIFSFYKDELKNNWVWIKRAALTFLVFIFIGGLVHMAAPQFIEQIVKTLADKIGGDFTPSSSLAGKIFINNLNATVLAIIGGVILGVIPLLVMAINGFLVGYILAYLLAESNQLLLKGLGFAAAALIPHGIFELSALFIAAGLSMKWGVNYLRKENAGNRWQVFKTDCELILRFLPLIIFLLVIAAFVETFVTSALVK
ncbi:MAG: hypothetical protein A3J48_00865 [Candidatus Doudnabacteria bacterium RIFCSPHIGHO2_02_FULL_46_11]|uniref:Stage II sporulation protein M n=1 Tax=Candidatus Doudnabacteria bacterium RIFCSPHIGHO2_02_FULL_46_11 TaxID=1817832 RepID=A0A1F5P8H6_9BACT|nr:MAG: hypothetical protein A3J48_00865 [Candidatus Doudnabacteria bacterium RIFCSPHIGHO2_02_FULL_46_11]